MSNKFVLTGATTEIEKGLQIGSNCKLSKDARKPFRIDHSKYLLDDFGVSICMSVHHC